jgi:hypothetical protein
VLSGAMGPEAATVVVSLFAGAGEDSTLGTKARKAAICGRICIAETLARTLWQ